MNRRHFLGTGLGTAAMLAAGGLPAAARPSDDPLALLAEDDPVPSPRGVVLNVKPVMTNIIHTGLWEGPCRWTGVAPAEEKARADRNFARWSEGLRKGRLAREKGVRLLDPVQITFSEDFRLEPGELARLQPDLEATDLFFVAPWGSSFAAHEIGARHDRPIAMTGLGCRQVDIAAYSRARGHEAFCAADEDELVGLLALLRARKAFRKTKVLFPTDRGLPAACSVGSIWDLETMVARTGVGAETVGYEELGRAVQEVSADEAAVRKAEGVADRLLAEARRSFIDRRYVVKSLVFYQAVRRLMARHACNAFTIECFEMCASRRAEQWQVTPCLVHSLHRDLGHASSCEGDLGSLLAMRMLMSVAGRACHQGNADPRPKGTFRINHSVPARLMAGYDRPPLPFQLGHFVSRGWGTKMLVDFMNHDEKTVTVARVDPTARKVLVLRGELVGASGWDRDVVGCSVEALIRPPEGRLDEFLRRRLEYGNHLQWVYGDHVEPMRRLADMVGLEPEVIA
jgi:hypothetical protein